MTDPDPEPAETGAGASEPVETPEEKRARVMQRLAEIIRADPPDFSSSGPVSAGGIPALPADADDFDQQSAAELFAALQQFFEIRKKPPEPEDPESE